MPLERSYLDHNATSPLRPEARDAMVEAMALVGNPSSVHAEGRDAKAMLERARRQVASLVGAKPDQVVFTSGGTEANAAVLARGEDELSVADFMRLVKEKSAELNVTPEMLKRPLNVGFSGGEKKRNEILQMAMLEPSLCVLDETDSGLDIDAIRIVSEGVNRLKSPDKAMLVITHYQRLLDYIVPDKVHVLSKGKIVKTGGKELALELEESGYAEFVNEAA